MEVHHHPNVEKKGLKEYLLEFVMIFLAVTLGFFAENIREYVADHAKEREYVISMIEDAATDTVNINKAVVLNLERQAHLDSLAYLCANYSGKDADDAAFYRHWSFGMIHPAVISPTERTMQQLKSGGGMRLIRKKSAVDSIVSYDDAAKKLADQQGYYELYQNAAATNSFTLFNFRNFRFIQSHSVFHDNDTSYKLLSQDKTALIEFGNKVSVYEGVINFYNTRLLEMKSHAAALIKTLKEAYDIEDQ
jgi:hypothetical protein